MFEFLLNIVNFNDANHFDIWRALQAKKKIKEGNVELTATENYSTVVHIR